MVLNFRSFVRFVIFLTVDCYYRDENSTHQKNNTRNDQLISISGSVQPIPPEVNLRSMTTASDTYRESQVIGAWLSCQGAMVGTMWPILALATWTGFENATLTL